MSSIRDLIDVMNEQFAVYGDLLALEKQKADVLSTGDVEALDAAINKEQSISMKAHNLEQKRIAIVGELGYENQTVTQIMAQTSEPDTSALGDVFDKLLETLTSLKQQNEVNMRVLESRLGVIDFLLSETPLGEQESRLYTSDAKQEKPGDKSGNLQRKV